MSLRKRGSIWWIDIVTPDGRRIRKSTGVEQKALAQEYHDRLKTQLWEQTRLGVQPELNLPSKPRHTWQEAAVRWLKEATHKATIEMDKTRLRWLDRHLRGKFLDEITRDLVDEIQAARLGEGVSNATVNRTLEALRAILRRAVDDWEWLDRAPKVRMLKEPKRRVRYLAHDEAQKLLSVLPAHLAEMAAFTLETGLRRANVTGLQWTQIDLMNRRAWIHPDQAKARKAIAVPLNAAAIAIIARQGGTHPKHAARTVLGPKFKITEGRGRFYHIADLPEIFATFHPSYILRLRDAARAEADQQLLGDLNNVAQRLQKS